MAAMAIGQVASKEAPGRGAESARRVRRAPSRGLIRRALGMSRDDFERVFAPGKSIRADRALPPSARRWKCSRRRREECSPGRRPGTGRPAVEVVGNGMGDLTRGVCTTASVTRPAALPIASEKSTSRRSPARRRDVPARRLRDREGSGRRLHGRDPTGAAVPLEHPPAAAEGLAIGVLGSIVGALVIVPAFGGPDEVALRWSRRTGYARGEGSSRASGRCYSASWAFGGPILKKAIGLLGKFGGVCRLIGSAARLARAPMALLGKAVGLLGGIVGRAMEHVATAPFRALGALRGALGQMIDAVRGLRSRNSLGRRRRPRTRSGRAASRARWGA